MSVISMTGFGRGEASRRGVKVVVELSSVNRKQFDCHITLPRELAALEANLHGLVHARVRRGQVKGSVNVSAASGSKRGGVVIDTELAAAQVAALRRVAKSLGLADDLTASVLLKLPDAVRFAAHPGEPLELWPLVEQAAGAALDQLHVMRRREGAALERDMTRRFAALRQPYRAICRRAPKVPLAYRRALADRMRKASPVAAADPAALAREQALFADRCDVSEELTRLASHFDQAEKLMAAKEPCGRPLDFLCQEMFREINTTGSKANDALISRQVIRMKTELEAIREQVQNVE